MRRTFATLHKVLVATPFDHQAIDIPQTQSMSSIVDGLVPKDSMSRKDEVKILLQRLPGVCDEKKQSLLEAQRASRYYRTRYGRGCETQRKQAQGLATMDDSSLRRWSANRCVAIANPLASWPTTS